MGGVHPKNTRFINRSLTLQNKFNHLIRMDNDETTNNPVLDEETITDEDFQFADEVENEQSVTEEETEDTESELTTEQELAKAKAEAAK